MLLAVVLVAGGCGGGGGGASADHFELGALRFHLGDFTQWALPHELREISGLALNPQGRLFAHADETGAVFEIDTASGRLVKRFFVGDPPVADDFEGIAWARGAFHLVTSDGTLLRFAEGADGEHVAFERSETGFGAQCEIEGLHAAADDVLLMACKTLRDPRLGVHLVLLAWSLAEARPEPARNVLVPLPAPSFNPSGLTRCPRSGSLLLVAAQQRALLEVSEDGALVRALRLPDRNRHPQMEGIELTAAGSLIIADEGANGRGRIGVYAAQ